MKNNNMMFAMDKKVKNAILADYKAACECLDGDKHFSKFLKHAKSLKSDYRKACESSSITANMNCHKIGRLLLTYGLVGMRHYQPVRFNTSVVANSSHPMFLELMKSREQAVSSLVKYNLKRLRKNLEGAEDEDVWKRLGDKYDIVELDNVLSDEEQAMFTDEKIARYQSDIDNGLNAEVEAFREAGAWDEENGTIKKVTATSFEEDDEDDIIFPEDGDPEDTDGSFYNI